MWSVICDLWSQTYVWSWVLNLSCHICQFQNRWVVTPSIILTLSCSLPSTTVLCCDPVMVTPHHWVSQSTDSWKTRSACCKCTSSFIGHLWRLLPTRRADGHINEVVRETMCYSWHLELLWHLIVFSVSSKDIVHSSAIIKWHWDETLPNLQLSYKQEQKTYFIVLVTQPPAL